MRHVRFYLSLVFILSICFSINGRDVDPNMPDLNAEIVDYLKYNNLDEPLDYMAIIIFTVTSDRNILVLDVENVNQRIENRIKLCLDNKPIRYSKAVPGYGYKLSIHIRHNPAI